MPLAASGLSTLPQPSLDVFGGGLGFLSRSLYYKDFFFFFQREGNLTELASEEASERTGTVGQGRKVELE